MHKLPPLPYAFDALEPYIDAATMEIHYTKHHQGYIDKLNAALGKYPDLLTLEVNELLGQIDTVPEDIRQAVINHGGGHSNHCLFWNILSANKSQPSDKLSKALKEAFGDFDSFKNLFTEKAMNVFGSGWAFLIIDTNGELKLKRHSFQNSPYLVGATPILGLDVWEHAYYLKYQNRRAEYVDAFWNIINWDEVSRIYENSISGYLR